MIFNNKIKIVILGLAMLCAGLVIWFVRPSAPDFSIYEPGPERKKVFFSYFLPIIEQRNQEIEGIRRQVKEWRREKDSLGWWEVWQINGLAEDYRIADFDIDNDADWNKLLRRVDTVPPSLALAQAAKESGWGTSRFARQGYNYFGQWCYEERCGIVPAQRGVQKRHEVASFDSPKESVESYMHNLNSHAAYKPLREIRAKLKTRQKTVTGIALADGLGKYSERGADYVKEIHSMIRNNDLIIYDAE